VVVVVSKNTAVVVVVVGDGSVVGGLVESHPAETVAEGNASQNRTAHPTTPRINARRRIVTTRTSRTTHGQVDRVRRHGRRRSSATFREAGRVSRRDRCLPILPTASPSEDDSADEPDDERPAEPRFEGITHGQLLPAG
jgi:hypothetical protein